MNVSSRTPEGTPSHCLLCGTNVNIEFSSPANDAPCPSCGHLVWKSTQLVHSLRVRIENTLGVSTNQMTADTPFYDIGADSLDAVEIVMQLEEDFDITIPDADAEQIRSIGDAVRFIEKARRQSIQ